MLKEEIYRQFGMSEGGYGLVTLHRPSNVDDPSSFSKIIKVFARLNFPPNFPCSSTLEKSKGF
jgi:UDP-N-acetylglucosamine 2-epimerase